MYGYACIDTSRYIIMYSTEQSYIINIIYIYIYVSMYTTMRILFVYVSL